MKKLLIFIVITMLSSCVVIVKPKYGCKGNHLSHPIHKHKRHF